MLSRRTGFYMGKLVVPGGRFDYRHADFQSTALPELPGTIIELTSICPTLIMLD